MSVDTKAAEDAFLMTVTKILFSYIEPNQLRIHKPTLLAAAKLVRCFLDAAVDEAVDFSRHARRKNIALDDILLLARRKPELLPLLRAAHAGKAAERLSYKAERSESRHQEEGAVRHPGAATAGAGSAGKGLYALNSGVASRTSQPREQQGTAIDISSGSESDESNVNESPHAASSVNRRGLPRAPSSGASAALRAPVQAAKGSQIHQVGESRAAGRAMQIPISSSSISPVRQVHGDASASARPRHEALARLGGGAVAREGYDSDMSWSGGDAGDLDVLLSEPVPRGDAGGLGAGERAGAGSAPLVPGSASRGRVMGGKGRHRPLAKEGISGILSDDSGSDGDDDEDAEDEEEVGGGVSGRGRGRGGGMQRDGWQQQKGRSSLHAGRSTAGADEADAEEDEDMLGLLAMMDDDDEDAEGVQEGVLGRSLEVQDEGQVPARMPGYSGQAQDPRNYAGSGPGGKQLEWDQEGDNELDDMEALAQMMRDDSPAPPEDKIGQQQQQQPGAGGDPIGIDLEAIAEAFDNDDL